MRLFTREPSAALIRVGVAHHCFLSRSYKPAVAEYVRLHEQFPAEPLLLLCVAVSLMQLVMSRANRERGHSALVAFGWLRAYAELADLQEASYNTARAYHHLALVQHAVSGYERVLELSRRRRDLQWTARDLSREAAHNLARILCASGNKDLARFVVRSMPIH